MKVMVRNPPKKFPPVAKQAGFIQAALLFGIALMTAVLGGFALANRSPSSQTDVEQAKVNASVILKQASDLRDGVARYASDFGASAVTSTMNFSTTTDVGLFDPVGRYASPQIMPTSAFATGEDTSIKAPAATVAGHWYINKLTVGNALSTGAADPMVVLPGLRLDVCQKINRLLYGSEAIATSTGSLADWATTPANAGISAVAALAGKPEACIETSNAKYVYYKAVQEN